MRAIKIILIIVISFWLISVLVKTLIFLLGTVASKRFERDASKIDFASCFCAPQAKR